MANADIPEASAPRGPRRPVDSPKVSPSALRWGALLLAAAAAIIIWPLWPALVLAAWFAVLTRPIMLRVSRLMRGRRRAAAVLTLLLLLVVLVPTGLLVASLVSGAIELFETLMRSKGGKDALAAIVSGEGPSHSFSVDDIVPLAQQYGERAVRLLRTIAGATARGVLGTFVFVLAAYTFLADGASMYAWIESHAPVAPRHFRRYAAAFVETGRGLVIGVGLTSLLQGVVATTAYLALGIPRPFVLGVLTAFASLVPSVGTALVWGPVAMGLGLTDRWIRAIIMVCIGVFVIGLVDNLLRPLLARHGKLRLPTLVLLVSMFGGLAAVGAWGLLLGPLVVRLAVEALTLEREERLERANHNDG